MKKIFSLSQLFLLITFLLSLIKSQKVNDVSKAVACMSIINKVVQEEGGEPDPRKFSPMMLNCFVTIKDEQLKDILNSMRSNLEFSNSQVIKELTDANGLQSKFQQEQLMEYSKRLNNAIDKFKKIQENRGGFSMEDLEGDDEHENKAKGKGNSGKKEKKNGGILGFLLGTIFDLGSSSYMMFGFFLLGMFFSLRFLKMLCKVNKPKKKVKKTE